MRAIVALLMLLILLAAPVDGAEERVKVASKQHTESVILTDILVGLGALQGIEIEHLEQLGGTRVIWQALLRGDIDAYVDYTGTLTTAILHDAEAQPLSSIRTRLWAQHSLYVTEPFGFDNSYGIGLARSVAQARGITEIGQLAEHPDLSFGFSPPFMDRADGWPGLSAEYGLGQSPKSVAHELGYEAVGAGQIDGMDVYTTDPEILIHDMVVLNDTRDFFSDYAAVVVYRSELKDSHPDLVAAFEGLAGQISDAAMREMNRQAKVERRSAKSVASEFVAELSGQSVTIAEKSRTGMIVKALIDHLIMVAISLTAAVVIAVPLGVASFLRPSLGKMILSVVAVIQTIPSLALFVFMIPVLGIGAAPAVAALFVYSLLPIVRNTFTGLATLPVEIKRSADALGLPLGARLWRIDLPIAFPTILAGIKTAAVINVGTATLGALIGAGGLGEPILVGIRLADTALILSGAVPAAVLALVMQGLFALLENAVMPAGLQRSGTE